VFSEHGTRNLDRIPVDERPNERSDDAALLSQLASVCAGGWSVRDLQHVLLAAGLAVAAAIGVLRLYQYQDCVEAHWGDWFYSGAVRASMVLGAGEIVFLSLVVPRLAQRLVVSAGDAASWRFPALLARRLGIVALILLALSAANISASSGGVPRFGSYDWVLMPQLAGAGVALLAASVSILLSSMRGSTAGAGAGTLTVAALPTVIVFARYFRPAWYWASSDPDGYCGSAWLSPLFMFFMSTLPYLPFLAAAVSLVALAAARLAWTLSRQSSGPERTS